MMSKWCLKSQFLPSASEGMAQMKVSLSNSHQQKLQGTKKSQALNMMKITKKKWSGQKNPEKSVFISLFSFFVLILNGSQQYVSVITG